MNNLLLLLALALPAFAQDVKAHQIAADEAAAVDAVDVIIEEFPTEGGGTGGADLPLPLVEGTVALFPFDENGGSHVVDISPEGHDGYTTGPAPWMPGISGSSLSFSLFGSILTCDSLDISGDWTIQAWTHFPLPETAAGWRSLVQSDIGVHAVIVDKEGRLGSMQRAVFKPCESGYSVKDVSDGWHLLSAVGTEGKTLFFVDGAMVGTVGTQVREPIRIIGNREDLGWYWGQVDCLRILKIARSTDEIAADATWYTAPAPLPTPTPDPLLPIVANTKALYSFGEGTGNRTADGTANLLHADITSPAAWTQGQAGTTALGFGGTGACVKTPAISIGDRWTLQGWTKFPLPATSEGWRSFVATTPGHSHVAVDADGNLGTRVYDWHPCGYNVSALNGWHLLSAVAKNMQTSFYVDGDLVGVSDTSELLDVLAIGNAGMYSGQNWGTIDCVRILTVARTAEEILVDANPTPAVPAIAGLNVVSGGSVHGSFQVRAGVSEIIALPVKIQVEMKPVGTTFDGTGLVESVAVPSGATASVTMEGPVNGDRHWRVRAICAAGGTPSAWVNDSLVHFRNSVPVAGTVSQTRVSDGSVIAPGGVVLDREEVRFSVALADADGDAVQLQVELTDHPAWETPFTAGGGTFSVSDIMTTGRKSWRYRVVDSMGAASAWTTAFDFEVIPAGSSQGGSTCLSSSSGGAVVLILGVLAGICGGGKRI